MLILIKIVFSLFFAIYIVFIPKDGYAHGVELIATFTDLDKINNRAIEVCEAKYPDSISTLRINIDKWKAEKRDKWVEFRSLLKELSNLDKSKSSTYSSLYKRLDSDFTADFLKMIESFSLEQLREYCANEHSELLKVDFTSETQDLKKELKQIKLREKENRDSKMDAKK